MRAVVLAGLIIQSGLVRFQELLLNELMPKVRVFGLKPNHKKSNLRGRLRKNHTHEVYETVNTKLAKVKKCRICKFHSFSFYITKFK